MKRKSLILTILVLNGLILSAQTNVNGILSQNTTWGLSNSPYIVTGNILIPTNISLTIEPGVKVKFNDGMYIKVEGAVIANGTESNHITFQSNSPSPNINSWKGIVIRQTGGTAFNSNYQYLSGSSFVNCDIMNSNKGLYVFNTGLLIRNCNFSNNYIGVEIRSTNNVIIDSCDFRLNTTGVFSEYEDYNGDYVNTITNTFIKNSQFVSNSVGIDLLTNQRDFINLNIKSNYFEKNTIGIDFGGGGYGPKVHSVIIDYNKFYINRDAININLIYSSANDQVGIPQYPIQISNNIIYKNTNNSIHFYGVSVSSIVNNNLIIENKNGILINGTTYNATFKFNNIIDNDFGIKIGNSSYSSYCPSNLSILSNSFSNCKEESLIGFTNGNGCTINNNNFLHAITYYIKNQTTTAINAMNNYWKNINSSLIYDYYDDFEFGKVDFSNNLAVPNINAPIACPTNITMTPVEGGVSLTWSANEESDLAGYKMRYGLSTENEYEHVIKLGKVTTYTLSGFSIPEQIKISAYDVMADGVNDQIEGHESWYGFESNQIVLTSTHLPNKNAINIYPVPAQNELFLNNLERNSVLTIYDLNGIKLLDRIATRNNEKIDLSNFTKGIYTISINDRKSVEMFKFIKQ